MARFLALAGLIGVAVLIGLVMFGNDGSYNVTATFENGGQLVKGNQVRVGGRSVGAVDSISLNGRAQAEVKMKLDKDLGDLHRGTTATVRASSLAGIANRYVSLQLGPNSAPKVPSGGQITADATDAPVDLDQLFNTLDPKTRKGLQQLIQGQATYFGGRSKDYGEAVKYASPALSTTSALTRQLIDDDATFDQFLSDASKAVGAIAERRDDLSSLVGSTNTAAGAIADENQALGRTIEQLPGTLRKGNTTFVNLRSTLGDLDTLTDVSKPATKDLATLFARLRPLVNESRPTVRNTRNLIRTPGANNDLIELTSKLPRLQSLTSTVFPRAIKSFNKSQATIDQLRTYTPDAVGFFTKFGQVAATYDANGHYARVSPIFTPFKADPSNGVLTKVPDNQRLDDFRKRQFQLCAGGAMQASPDGSSPIAGSGCKTSASPGN